MLIEQFLLQLSTLDSNNFANKVGAGEREGRVFSDIVQKRHFYMSHGIGRSGDIAATQPKAAGSSLAAKICECLVKYVIKNILASPQLNNILILPLATGMALSLCLQSLKNESKQQGFLNKRYVIQPRID